MDYMDFIILKVNGTDVSGSSHADAVREFLAAEEPIVVEVVRRVNNSPKKEEPPENLLSPETNSSNQIIDELEASTCFNLESPIYTNKSIIETNCNKSDNNNSANSMDSNHIHNQLVLKEIYDEDFEDDESLEEEVLNGVECDEEGLIILKEDYQEEFLEEVDEALYENSCVLNNTCMGSECCCGESSSTNNSSSSSKKKCENIQEELCFCTCSNTHEQPEEEHQIAVSGDSRQLVSRSVQTHITSFNWMNDFDHCLIHIDLQTKPHNTEDTSKTMKEKTTPSLCDKTIKATPALPTSDVSTGIENEHQKGDGRNENIFVKSPTNSFIRTQLDSINEQIAELDHRMHKIHIVNKNSKAVSGSESDMEHIYETIQESEIEPIYSSPYEPNKSSDQNTSQPTSGVSIHKKKRSKSISAGSSGSGEGAGDSSSAYNTGTGGSSNSNHHSQTPLTFKLGCSHTNRSVLQLCSPSEWANFGNHHRYDNIHRVSTTTGRMVTKEKHRIGVPSSKSQPIHQIPADTMYTNMANLHQTILLQQQLFRQALNQRPPNKTRENSNSTFPGNNQTVSTSLIQHRSEKDGALKMEWKVKRRQNGTRYITRRPIRNRILRNRTKEIIEERAAELTTEDETCSEIKLGRYWTKEERKRQILERHRKVHNQMTETNCKNCMKMHRLQQSFESPTIVPPSSSKKSPKSVAPNLILPSPPCVPPKKISALPQYDKKSLRKKSQHKDTITDDFKTVQEMIVNGNRPTTSSTTKMIGLLSVTTV